MGYVPQSDALDYIHEGDTVEIYTTDNWQIFRNLVFFDFLDATIDEISTFYWTRDSKRNASISTEGLRLIFLIKTGMLKKTFLVQTMPPYEVSCTLSGRLQRVKIEQKMGSPLMDRHHRVQAYLVTNKSTRLEA